MPSPGEYVLLPQGTMTAPNHGILYAQIVEGVTMAATNPLNVSTRKRKKAWKLMAYVDPPTELEVPKHLVIGSIPSATLSEELETKPREFLGTFVAKQMADNSGQGFPNYGQVVDIIAPTGDKTEWGFLVTFRPLHDGNEIDDHVFTEEEISSHDVTIQQYALGLGMGEVFTDPEGQALRFADSLESFPKTASLSSYRKSFMSVVIAPPTCIILNARLDPMEIDLDLVLSGYTGLKGLIVPNEPFKRSLTQEFSDFQIGSSPTGVTEIKPVVPSVPNPGVTFDTGVPTTPIPGPAASFLGTASLPIVMDSNNAIPTMQSRNSVRQLMRQTATNAQAQMMPIQASQAAFDPSTFKQQHMANKLAYVPTEPQMHKHSVTFRSGVYGKSTTRVEHMAGIEIVFERELQFAASRANAIIRSKCIMGGAAYTAPMQVWESSEIDSFLFEEIHGDIQWSKAPDVVLVAIDDLDKFWRLYNQMQLAAGRYYVDEYSRVLEHVKQNLKAGFLNDGGTTAFDGLHKENRVTILQCAIKYMRAVMGKYMNEMLLPCSQVPLVQWLSLEGMQSELYTGQIVSRWRSVQMLDMRKQMANRSPGVQKDKEAKVDNHPKRGGPNSLSQELRDTIPKVDGINACLVSFTNKGCNNAMCTYKKRTPAMGQLNPAVQEWLISTHGSYKK